MDFIDFRHFDTIDSTQTYCEQHLDEFDSNKITVVSASHQTAGRGTGTRKWESPAGVAVHMTIVFRVPNTRTFDTTETPTVTCVLALAAMECMEKAANNETKFTMKWPNDVILNEKKVGGILAKYLPESATILIGIGLNINTPEEALDAIDRPIWPASSLMREFGSVYDVADLRKAIAESFAQKLQVFFREGFAPFKDVCSQRQTFFNRQVTFSTGSEVITGIFRGLTDAGWISLEVDGGVTKSLCHGEIVPCKP
eukprot:GEMP01067866.1.p1 GENE.GEMP01067866.1~~GEMP01067866.1.p1  ORF type:complete len:255 (+),score=51.85 GEMP01067866.1:45-809(+)